MGRLHDTRQTDRQISVRHDSEQPVLEFLDSTDRNDGCSVGGSWTDGCIRRLSLPFVGEGL